MKTGDFVTRRPVTFGAENPLHTATGKRAMTGRVVYIHPKGRFHVAEFPTPRGQSIRECFYGKETQP